MFHLFSAVGWETCTHLIFIIHYKIALPPLAVRLFKWDITAAHFLARYRQRYSLSDHNDWQCGEARWPVEINDSETNTLIKIRQAYTSTHNHIYIYNKQIEIYGAHIQPCGNKANALFSPYVLLKQALFDLKLIGQAWAQGLKAWTAGLSTAAQVVVEVGEECLSLSLSLCLRLVFICPSVLSVVPCPPLSMLCCSHFLPLLIC